MERTPINVTRSFLPPREEFDAWMDKVYAGRVLTNNGPIHKELEETLCDRFKMPHLRLLANGTLALQLAIRALGITGKVITTPFSYVATTSSILWEGCEPVFVDVDPKTCCIDTSLIESAITPDVTAILATHVYGIPCDVEAIDTLAKKHGLKVIYDAAHAFDVEYKGKSILSYGDASILSFHATKLFHTVEGGAVVLHDAEADKKLCLLRSFGHIYDEHFCLGINAKMSELHAAMGMAVLPHVEQIIAERKKLVELYDILLAGRVEQPIAPKETVQNHGYYPIILNTGEAREKVMAALASEGIFARRYFFPSLDTLPYVSSPVCAISRSISDRVICLPLYAELADADVKRIASIVVASVKS
ncbi:MAG: DegT/DnrJ/EryC1/StrS family aminotransferase [Flavobacteriales bacterium]|jgi:dTDP-4-amino-4,6-dideoxygalactose transaminase|nr:DegT/DnrJ/EryC1/StrS family aminotransferase [Flavobacteriales bacterium]